MKLNKIIAGTSALALSLSMTSVAFAATDSETNNLQVEVQDALTFECHDLAGSAGDLDVDLGTVTAGTPEMGGSRCTATTNDDSGYYLTIVNASTHGTGDVLEHEDPNNAGTWYSISDVTAWADNTIGGTTGTSTWTDGTTTGLGFTIENFPDDTYSNSSFAGSEWGTNTNTASPNTNCDTGVGDNRFAGVPDSAQTIAAVTQYESGQTVTDVCYKVDVPTTQQSGTYTGSVTYTATTDASAYYFAS